jgi:2,3-diketo-5-methylthiopentyl-1-phosphate enolase
MNDPIGFAMPEGIDLETHVLATYLMRTRGRVDIHQEARALAELQSTGTWVALERETPQLRERHAGRVTAIWEVPDHEVEPSASDDGDGRDVRDWVLQIAFPAHNIGNQIPLLLATVYGECASGGELRLLDMQLPRSFVSAFPGPRFGLPGIRDLVGVTGRPLLVAMLKPAIGLTPPESAEVFRQCALGGVDAVKDDELLVSHPWSAFVDRVREHERVAREVFEATGHRTLYFVNITDRPDRLVDNARRAVDAGASGLMVDHVTVGVASLATLAEDPSLPVPILGHLAFAGAIYAPPRTGVSSHLVLGKLPRLAGADLVVYPSPYGSLRYSRFKHLRLAQAMTDPFHGLLPTVPAPGGGLHAGLVPLLVADLGIDHAFGAGGAIHGHPQGAAAGARAIRQAIDAVVGGIALDEAARDHSELAAALQKWPQPAGA